MGAFFKPERYHNVMPFAAAFLSFLVCISARSSSLGGAFASKIFVSILVLYEFAHTLFNKRHVVEWNRAESARF